MCTCVFYRLCMEYHKNAQLNSDCSLVYCIVMFLLCSYVAVFYINCDMNYVSCCMKLLVLAVHSWTNLNVVQSAFHVLSLLEQHGPWCAVWPCHVSVISCGTGKLGPVQWVLGHSQGKVAWVVLSTSSHPRLRLKQSRCIPLPPFCAFMAG
jgi:hypothetical protein